MNVRNSHNADSPKCAKSAHPIVDETSVDQTSREHAPRESESRPKTKSADVRRMFEKSDFQEQIPPGDERWRHRIAVFTALLVLIACLVILTFMLNGLGRGDELRPKICTALIGLAGICLAYILRINLRAFAQRIATIFKDP